MNLKEFIEELEKIAQKVNDPRKVEVEMADCVPVVKPILKDNKVYITDIDPEKSEN
ncbi:MAG: hypothetical protein ACPLXO_04305 [Desulfurella sp.]